jgi:hypothetical protein
MIHQGPTKSLHQSQTPSVAAPLLVRVYVCEDFLAVAVLGCLLVSPQLAKTFGMQGVGYNAGETLVALFTFS